MIMKGIFTYDKWGMLQRFVGKLVETFQDGLFNDLLQFASVSSVPPKKTNLANEKMHSQDDILALMHRRAYVP